MEDHTTNHALTEVALALAMAFFSIMILAMVSMSIPRASTAQATEVDLPEDKVKMQQSGSSQSNSSTNNSSKVKPSKSQQFVFYFNGHFYNQKLQVIDLNSLKSGEVVLALPANLTVAKALQVKGQINRSDLVITQYNEDWQQRLERIR